MVTPAVTADVVALNKSDLGEIRLGLTVTGGLTATRI